MAIEPKYDYTPDFVVLQSLVIFGGTEYGSRGGIVFYDNDSSEVYSETEILDLLNVSGEDENLSRWYDLDDSFGVDEKLPTLKELAGKTFEESLDLLPVGEISSYIDYN